MLACMNLILISACVLSFVMILIRRIVVGRTNHSGFKAEKYVGGDGIFFSLKEKKCECSIGRRKY